MKLTDVIRRPLITEKTTVIREDGRTLVFQVARDANKIDIKRAVEQLLGSKVAERAHVAGARQDEAPGPVRGPALGLEEGVREAAGRREAARVPAGRVGEDHRCRFANTTRHRLASAARPSLTFDEITTSEPYRPLTENLHRSGGRNNQGELTSWWRGGGHKRLYRDHRLQARQEGHPGQGRRRSSTTRTARRASRCVTYADGEKRYILQPVGDEGGRHDRGRRQRRHPAGQLPAAEEHPARHARFTTSSCGRARAARSRAAPGRRCSWWRARASTPR